MAIFEYINGFYNPRGKHPALGWKSPQDRDGAPVVLNSIGRSFPWLRRVFADGGYAGAKPRGALDKIGQWTLQTVKRSDAVKGFEVLPRRWAVERAFFWPARRRGLAQGLGANHRQRRNVVARRPHTTCQ